MKQHTILVGPDKAGTDWIFAAVRHQQSVSLARSKELMFFNKRFDRGETWYWEQFAHQDRDTLEICHDYLFDFHSPARISEVIPSARIAVVARNPIDRLLSAFSYMQYQGRVRCSLERALSQEPELIDHGLYARHLRGFLNHFPSNNIAILDFRLLGSDPRRFLADLLGEHPETIATEALDVPIQNAAVTPRFPMLNRLARTILHGVQHISPSAATSLKTRVPAITSRKLHTKPVLPAHLESSLRSVFVPDALELDRVFGTSFAEVWFGDNQDLHG